MLLFLLFFPCKLVVEFLFFWFVLYDFLFGVVFLFGFFIIHTHSTQDEKKLNFRLRNKIIIQKVFIGGFEIIK
jgi:hypothetical protein